MRFKDRYQACNAEVEMCALFATRNSLKLQEVRKVFLPIRNIHARTLKLWSHRKLAVVEIHSTFRPHAADKSP
jgi:inosine/xanthosine triphosphate pyrophosphatase family protein